jgi:hypothetical protein
VARAQARFRFEADVMRTYLKALLLVGFGTMQMLEAAPSVWAADLAVRPVRKASVRVIHHRRSPIVRDYDGTAIIVRRTPVLMQGYDGTLVATVRYDAHAVRGPQPARYLNGQRVLPNFPRGWPRPFRVLLGT